MIRPGLLLLGGLLLLSLVAGPSLVSAQPVPATPAPAPSTGGTNPTPAGGGATPPTTITKTGFIGKLGATVGCNTGKNAAGATITIDPSTDLGTLISYLICILSRYATAIAVLIIMAAGLLYITSGANPAAAGTAKAMIITTLTGIVAMYSISLVLSILINTGVVKKSADPTTPAPVVTNP